MRSRKPFLPTRRSPRPILSTLLPYQAIHRRRPKPCQTKLTHGKDEKRGVVRAVPPGKFLCATAALRRCEGLTAVWTSTHKLILQLTPCQVEDVFAPAGNPRLHLLAALQLFLSFCFQAGRVPAKNKQVVRDNAGFSKRQEDFLAVFLLSSTTLEAKGTTTLWANDLRRPSTPWFGSKATHFLPSRQNDCHRS